MKAHDLEALREVVESVQRGVESLRESGISERALLLLIVHASPPMGRRSQKVTQAQVRAVLDGMEGLAEFVFPSEEEQEA